MRTVATPEHGTGQRADRRALAEIDDLIDEGVYDAASVLAWEVQRTAPGDPAVWLLLARIDYIRERFAAAIYAARMATRLDPSSSEAWLALAMTSVTRSRWRTEGLDAALQATALAPGDVRAWIVLSQLHLQGGASYAAAIAAERAVRIAPSDRGGHLMLGEIALEAQEWAHAEAAFRRVLALDGSDVHARAGLREALEAQGVDAADELARYGAPPPQKVRRPRRNVPVVRSDRETPAGTTLSASRVTALVTVGSLLLGLVAGLVLPGLGVVRGLVAGAAVALMWLAVRPLRRAVSPDPAAEDHSPSRTRPASRSQPRSRPPSGTRPAATARRTATHRDGAAAGARHGSAADRPPAAPDTARDGSAGDDAEAGTATGRDDQELDDAEANAGLTAAEVLGDASFAGEPGSASRRPASGDEDRPNGDTSSGEDVDHRDAPTPPRPPRGEVAVDMPDDPAELAELSRERLAVSDLELAHAAASHLEAVSPGTVEAHRALAAVALAEQDYDQARHHYRKVLELEPLDQEAHERLALVGDDIGRAGPRFPLRGFRSQR